MKSVTFATIEIQMSKAGLHCICEDLEEDVFCVGDDLSPLVNLINRAEDFCNPDTRFTLTEKGKQEVERMKEEDDE